MKKSLLILMLFILSASLCAQDEVTKFLGIPVDGNKSEMIKKLKAKGYKSSLIDKDILVGEFNGTNVNIHIVTKGDKVYRIAVIDANPSSETDIKIRFNELCRQFDRNKKYLSASLSDYTLSEEENISYEMLVQNKRYQASYYQLPAELDSTTISKEIELSILSKYTKEELPNITEELKKDILVDTWSTIIKKCSMRSVWFMINKEYSKYYISIFYDNEYNNAKGEDL
ncbi:MULTISPECIES: hypothetical protein [unclassified Dysgonomonas]|uniref:hypothetical protein n=1 Tax=unclassified Dysgonomonas TaxID=2630389 RepID=UPI0025C0DF43|nr:MULTISPECIES: hypothetical protein [unclassified Dysgonomonas]